MLLGIYRVNKILSIGISGILIIGSWVFNIMFTQNHNNKLFTDVSAFADFMTYFLNVYIKPYARWTTYILGTYLGLLYC